MSSASIFLEKEKKLLKIKNKCILEQKKNPLEI